MSVATRSPLRELETLRERFDRLFNEMTVWPRPTTEPAVVPLDVQETEREVVVHASLPGIRPEDMTVEVSRGVLTIHGETKEEREETEGTWHVRELRRGLVHRRLPLPAPVYEDEATAEFVNGVLTITFPKSQTEPRRTIAVTTPATPET